MPERLLFFVFVYDLARVCRAFDSARPRLRVAPLSPHVSGCGIGATYPSRPLRPRDQTIEQCAATGYESNPILPRPGQGPLDGTMKAPFGHEAIARHEWHVRNEVETALAVAASLDDHSSIQRWMRSCLTPRKSLGLAE